MLATVLLNGYYPSIAQLLYLYSRRSKQKLLYQHKFDYRKKMLYSTTRSIATISEVPKNDYEIECLYEDTVARIPTLKCAPCHFVGLSMGGLISLRLGIRRPDLIKSLTLIESSADPEAKEAARRYRMLSIIARWIGLRIVADRVMEIMFGQKFLNDPERAGLKREWKERMVANDRIGITRAVGGVIIREGVGDQLDRIKIPTLIIVGDQDVATIPAKAEKMHAGIPNSKLVVIPGAGHTSTVEEPEIVTAAMVEFFENRAEER